MSTFFIVLLVFLIFGVFFSPLLGGCIWIFMVFTILGLLFIFLSLNFVWFAVAGVIIYIFGYIHKLWRWHKLPDITVYFAKYPDCKLDSGVGCYSCGSTKLINQGLFRTTGKLRFYSCGSCGTILFRFKVL